MKKIHVQFGDKWLPVFCANNGVIITCEDAPKKALPTVARYGSDDLAYFQKKFANHNFKLIKPTKE